VLLEPGSRKIIDYIHGNRTHLVAFLLIMAPAEYIL